MNQQIQHYQQIQQAVPDVEQDDAIDLRKYLVFILDNLKLIAGIAFIVTLLGVAYAFIARPVYEANILVQVEDNKGTQTNSNILRELASAFDFNTMASSEMEVLRSRMVVARAVDNTALYIKVEPNYFPIIGAWLARRSKQLSEPGLFGYGSYVWGAEKASVSLFNVPEEAEGAPFTLMATGENSFIFSQEDMGTNIPGRVGETLKFRYGNGLIELRVDQLAAKPGAEFQLTRQPRVEAIEKLQQALKIQEKGKQSSVIGVSLSGEDPKLINSVLHEIGREYIRQNEDRRSEEAEKSLAFLNEQLPDLKKQLEAAEVEYNSFRNRHGIVDLGEDAKNSLQQSTTAQTRLVELKQKREELLTRYEKAHPSVEAIEHQIDVLDAELAMLGARIKKLPLVEQEAVRLSREVKVNTDLYTALLGTAQQLRLVTASKVANVRLLDTPALPVKPVQPRRLLVAVLSAVLGVILGILAAVVRKSFSGRVNYPHEIEERLGLMVAATIPHDESQRLNHVRTRSAQHNRLALDEQVPSDDVIESLRRFRTSLQFAMAGNDNNIIVITGPTPGVGKSFVSVNFACVLAGTGKRVVLVDGDLRTGYLHRYFGLERKNGLSEAITGDLRLDQVIHRNVAENVDFIATGSLHTKPGELLAHDNLHKLLQLLSSRYDFVLLDTAPVLAASDALTVGPYAGAMFNIVRGGVSTVEEIEETVKRLNQAGATVTGTVFNDLKPQAARYGYAARYGTYRYAR